MNEITAQHWKLIARIARETEQRVVVPIHPPLALGTARTVRDGVVDLIRTEQDAGHTVRLAGDSSGGQIAPSAALRLRDDGRTPLDDSAVACARSDMDEPADRRSAAQRLLVGAAGRDCAVGGVAKGRRRRGRRGQSPARRLGRALRDQITGIAPLKVA
ncbi:MAG: hypothetical protein ABI310_04290, partial [Microbacteriaceae bacterium]